MVNRCLECGAPLDPAGSCRDHFESLLALEWQILGGPGALPHFFAVATYGLQHPHAMNYTRETLIGLRNAVADALIGRASIEELRRRARRGVKESGRVTRRDEDVEVGWQVSVWPMTIADVLPTMVEQESYAHSVSQWARSVLDTLEGHDPAT